MHMVNADPMNEDFVENYEEMQKSETDTLGRGDRYQMCDARKH